MTAQALLDVGIEPYWIDSPSGSCAPDVDRAVASRHSVRAFLERDVDRHLIDRMLNVARFAPSGSNIQPWRAHVLFRKKLRELGLDMQRTYLAKEPGQHKREYNYYEISWDNFEPYASRRQACGWGLYNTLKIARHEKERLAHQRSQNFNFFNAPVALFFVIDKGLELGSWLDYGMFLQSLNLMARQYGLHTCTMASVSEFPLVVRRHLPIKDSEFVMIGMAIGYKDDTALINNFRTTRASLGEFATFFD